MKSFQSCWPPLPFYCRPSYFVRKSTSVLIHLIIWRCCLSLMSGMRLYRNESYTGARGTLGDCKGFQMDREGFQMDREGFQMDREGFQMDREGFQMDREGFQMDREGLQMDREGLQMDREGLQMDREGLRGNAKRLHRPSNSLFYLLETVLIFVFRESSVSSIFIIDCIHPSREPLFEKACRTGPPSRII